MPWYLRGGGDGGHADDVMVESSSQVVNDVLMDTALSSESDYGTGDNDRDDHDHISLDDHSHRSSLRSSGQSMSRYPLSDDPTLSPNLSTSTMSSRGSDLFDDSHDHHHYSTRSHGDVGEVSLEGKSPILRRLRDSGHPKYVPASLDLAQPHPKSSKKEKRQKSRSRRHHRTSETFEIDSSGEQEEIMEEEMHPLPDRDIGMREEHIFEEEGTFLHDDRVPDVLPESPPLGRLEMDSFERPRKTMHFSNMAAEPLASGVHTPVASPSRSRRSHASAASQLQSSLASALETSSSTPRVLRMMSEDSFSYPLSTPGTPSARLRARQRRLDPDMALPVVTAGTTLTELQNIAQSEDSGCPSAPVSMRDLELLLDAEWGFSNPFSSEPTTPSTRGDKSEHPYLPAGEIEPVAGDTVVVPDFRGLNEPKPTPDVVVPISNPELLDDVAVKDEKRSRREKKGAKRKRLPIVAPPSGFIRPPQFIRYKGAGGGGASDREKGAWEQRPPERRSAEDPSFPVAEYDIDSEDERFIELVSAARNALSRPLKRSHHKKKRLSGEKLAAKERAMMVNIPKLEHMMDVLERLAAEGRAVRRKAALSRVAALMVPRDIRGIQSAPPSPGGRGRVGSVTYAHEDSEDKATRETIEGAVAVLKTSLEKKEVSFVEPKRRLMIPQSAPASPKQQVRRFGGVARPIRPQIRPFPPSPVRRVRPGSLPVGVGGTGSSSGVVTPLSSSQGEVGVAGTVPGAGDLDPCSACLSAQSYKGNELVYCDGCGVCVHQFCYGVPNLPVGPWLCDWCASMASSVNTSFSVPGVPIASQQQQQQRKRKCVFCHRSETGALKRTTDGRWAHVICALWLSALRFLSVETDAIEGAQRVVRERRHLLCAICSKRGGACMVCSHSGCTYAAHVTCAVSRGMSMGWAELPDRSVSFQFLCDEHAAKQLPIPPVAALKIQGQPGSKAEDSALSLQAQAPPPSSAGGAPGTTQTLWSPAQAHSDRYPLLASHSHQGRPMLNIVPYGMVLNHQQWPRWHVTPLRANVDSSAHQQVLQAQHEFAARALAHATTVTSIPIPSVDGSSSASSAAATVAVAVATAASGSNPSQHSRPSMPGAGTPPPVGQGHRVPPAAPPLPLAASARAPHVGQPQMQPQPQQQLDSHRIGKALSLFVPPPTIAQIPSVSHSPSVRSCPTSPLASRSPSGPPRTILLSTIPNLAFSCESLALILSSDPQRLLIPPLDRSFLKTLQELFVKADMADRLRDELDASAQSAGPDDPPVMRPKPVRTVELDPQTAKCVHTLRTSTVEMVFDPVALRSLAMFREMVPLSRFLEALKDNRVQAPGKQAEAVHSYWLQKRAKNEGRPLITRYSQIEFSERLVRTSPVVTRGKLDKKRRKVPLSTLHDTHGKMEALRVNLETVRTLLNLIMRRERVKLHLLVTNAQYFREQAGLPLLQIDPLLVGDLANRFDVTYTGLDDWDEQEETRHSSTSTDDEFARKYQI